MNESAVIAFAIVVALTVAVHFAFIGYLVIGGFLAQYRAGVLYAAHYAAPVLMSWSVLAAAIARGWRGGLVRVVPH
jgi:hypothetical protein